MSESQGHPSQERDTELQSIEPESLDVDSLVLAVIPVLRRSTEIYLQSDIDILKIGNHYATMSELSLHAISDPEIGAQLLGRIEEAFKNSHKDDLGSFSDGYGTPKDTLKRLLEWQPLFRDRFERFLYCASMDQFEIFIAEMLITLNYCFPRAFLDRDGIDKGTVPARLLLEGGTLLDARLRFVELRVQNQIFSESMPGAIKKLVSRLEKPFEYSEATHRELTQISIMRNLFTHNRGVVNATFLTRLRKAGITSRWKLGETIQLAEGNAAKQRELLRSLAIVICESLEASVLTLAHRELSLR